MSFERLERRLDTVQSDVSRHGARLSAIEATREAHASADKLAALEKLIDKLDASAVAEWRAQDIRIRSLESMHQNLLGKVTVVAFFGAAVASAAIGLLFRLFVS